MSNKIFNEANGFKNKSINTSSKISNATRPKSFDRSKIINSEGSPLLTNMK